MAYAVAFIGISAIGCVLQILADTQSARLCLCCTLLETHTHTHKSTHTDYKIQGGFENNTVPHCAHTHISRIFLEQRTYRVRACGFSVGLEFAELRTIRDDERNWARPHFFSQASTLLSAIRPGWLTVYERPDGSCRERLRTLSKVSCAHIHFVN